MFTRISPPHFSNPFFSGIHIPKKAFPDVCKKHFPVSTIATTSFVNMNKKLLNAVPFQKKTQYLTPSSYKLKIPVPFQPYRPMSIRRDEVNADQLKKEYEELITPTAQKKRNLEEVRLKFGNLQHARKKEIAYFLASKFEKESEGHLQSKEEAKAKECLYHAEKYLSQCVGKEAALLQAKVCFKLGQIAAPKNSYEAVYYYHEALKALPKNNAYLPDFHQLGVPMELEREWDPNLAAQIRTYLGNASFLEGDLKTAQECYKDVVEKDTAKKEAKIEAWIGLACIELIQKGVNTASRSFNEALKVNQEEAAKLITDFLLYFIPHYYFRAETNKYTPAVEAPIFSDYLIQFQNDLEMYSRLLNNDSGKIKKNFPKIQQVLNEINDTIKDPEVRLPLTAEVILKLWAFYHPLKGDTISLPSTQYGKDMISYKVDEIIWLDKDIPAYGLVSTLPNQPPVLIYRGTAPALSRTGGAKSLKGDFDPKGVGKQMFDASYNSILKWLKTATEKTGANARVFGYSQGASLAGYTIVNFPQYINENPAHPSATVNPPGIDPISYKVWEGILQKCKKEGKNHPQLKGYMVAGDSVSRCGGSIPGELYEIVTPQKYGVLEAHLELAFFQHGWKMYKVKPEDNQAPLRKFISGFVGSEYGKSIYKTLDENTFVKLILAINKATSHSTSAWFLGYAGSLLKLLTKILP